MDDDETVDTTPRTWEAFAESPATLFQPQRHPARLLRKREQKGRLQSRTSATPAAYTPDFTPFEMRHRLGFVTKAFKRNGLEMPLKHDGCINAACWSEDGQLLFSGGDDRLVKTWDASRDFVRKDLFSTGHEGNIFGVQVVPSRPEVLLTCSADGTLRRHDICSDISSRGPERVVGTCAPHVLHGFCFWDGGSGGGGGQVVLTAQGNGIVMKYDMREPSTTAGLVGAERFPSRPSSRPTCTTPPRASLLS